MPSPEEFSVDVSNSRDCPSPTPGLNFRDPTSFTASDVNVIFSYHGFLATGSFSHTPVTDFKFLETKGCFHVPSRPVLDEFVVEYFLHVHPMLPILDEGAFWDMYLSDGQLDQQAKKISLFTFRAMLFVASSVSLGSSSQQPLLTRQFVSSDTIKLLGFKDTFDARSTLYRQAKLLYDFDTISNPIAVAQGALLLSYYCSGREPVCIVAPTNMSVLLTAAKLVNTFWLRVAIQYAQAERAHVYHQSLSLPLEVRRERKRLWWFVWRNIICFPFY